MAAPRTETLTIFNMLPKRFFPPKALPVAVAPAPRGRRRRFAKLSSFVIVIAENRSVSEACDSTPRQCRRHHVIMRSEEHTSELQSLMRISYAVFCFKNNIEHLRQNNINTYDH